MVTFDSRFLHSFALLAGSAVLLSGCSFNDTYPDATEADAARLRFISGMDNVTMDVFDAAHCGGQTTGLMNNLFSADTQRRAGMSIAPSTDDEPYLEIRLKPGNEVLLRPNTLSTGSVCTNAFNFVPQANAEYELTFSWRDRQCVSSLMRLHALNGEVVRSPVPLLNNGLPSCAGSNPVFPAAPTLLPDTPERTAMIAQIIDDSVTEQMKAELAVGSEAERTRLIEKSLKERQQKITFTLPPAYWTEYRQNLQTYTQDMMASKARALQLYKDDYRTRLRQLDDAELKRLLPDSDSADEGRILEVNSARTQYYRALTQDVFKQGYSDHLSRMADLDRRYGVCERLVDCWKN